GTALPPSCLCSRPGAPGALHASPTRRSSDLTSTTITATTPAHAAGAVGLTVTNPDSQSATLAGSFTYVVPPPTVTGVSPASGSSSGGTAVTITRTGFAACATVTIGDNAATGV